MKRTATGDLIYSPSDLIRYLKSPFASWMDRYYSEFPNALIPDEETDDEKLIAQTGDKHEADVLSDFRQSCPEIAEIRSDDLTLAKAMTVAAFQAKAPIVYQAALELGVFAGFADFIELASNGRYQVWDTKQVSELTDLAVARRVFDSAAPGVRHHLFSLPPFVESIIADPTSIDGTASKSVQDLAGAVAFSIKESDPVGLHLAGSLEDLMSGRLTAKIASTFSAWKPGQPIPIPYFASEDE